MLDRLDSPMMCDTVTPTGINGIVHSVGAITSHDRSRFEIFGNHHRDYRADSPMACDMVTPTGVLIF